MEIKKIFFAFLGRRNVVLLGVIACLAALFAAAAYKNSGGEIVRAVNVNTDVSVNQYGDECYNPEGGECSTGDNRIKPLGGGYYKYCFATYDGYYTCACGKKTPAQAQCDSVAPSQPVVAPTQPAPPASSVLAPAKAQAAPALTLSNRKVFNGDTCRADNMCAGTPAGTEKPSGVPGGYWHCDGFNWYDCTCSSGSTSSYCSTTSPTPAAPIASSQITNTPGFSDCVAKVQPWIDQNQTCNSQDNRDLICGWGGQSNSSVHCYCDNGKWKIDNNLFNYCKVCFQRDKICKCTYTPPASTPGTTPTPVVLNWQQKKCGDAATEMKNYEVVCDNPAGEASKKACLNRKTECQNGTGCGAEDSGCKAMNDKVREFIQKFQAGKINADGTSNVKPRYSYVNGVQTMTNQSEVTEIDTLISKISGYGLSGAAIIDHVKNGGAYQRDEDMACASELAKMCGSVSRGKEQYACEIGISGEDGATNCRMWAWAKFKAGENDKVKKCANGCAKGLNGKELNYCDGGAEVPVTPLDQGCKGTGRFGVPALPTPKITPVGGYSCGGQPSTEKNSFQCLGPDNWSDPIYCPTDQPCNDATGQCGYSEITQKCLSTRCWKPADCTAACGEGATCDFMASRSSNPSNTGSTSSYAQGYCKPGRGGVNPEESKECTKENYTCQGKNGVYTDKCYDNSTASDASKSSSNAYTLTYECNGDDNCEEGKVDCKYGCSKSTNGHSCATSKSDCMKPSEETQDPETKKEEEGKEEEQQKEEDNTPPTVSVTSPTGTITTKTAELKATTNIKAICKYSDNKSGTLSASNFDGGGMAMNDGDGYQHTATLSNLAEGEATDCKYNHNITVLCKNAAANTTKNRSGSSGSAVGSGQTTFTVDLSKDASNAPKVTSGMESEKITIANPVLKAITDRPADCEYKEGSDFTIGAGKKFDTTGSYNHNAQLSGLTGNGGKPYVYYVVCKDKTTCAANTPGTQIKFTVTLEDDPQNQPKIVSTTPETQTVANPTLSVTTDRPATCQYKKDATFKYGDEGATQFTNDAEYSHTASLSSLADGEYKFYVACKDKATGAAKTLETPVTTKLIRGQEVAISNTTPNIQNLGATGISVITAKAATCQYKEGSAFTYGSGTQFATDGGTGHISELPNLPEGQHTFYVVCKDAASGAVNSVPAQIMFTVVPGATTCANLTSNDKQNDDERDGGGEEADSKYLWRSVESGTRDKFTKVDWYAGYQFTPSEDGQVTQLCGYFESGDTNKVILYNSSYKEIASVQITGEDGWKCANISATAVKTDKRYYVIARIKDGPINYEYKAGLLPRDGETATVESGIRQLAGKDFGEDIKKYDYMVFGLVDVKIKPTPSNNAGPAVDSASPVGTVSGQDTVISVQTNIDATCKFSRDDLEYADMKYTFSSTSGKTHQQKVCQLDDGPFTFYVRCKGAAGTNNASTMIQFEVND